MEEGKYRNGRWGRRNMGKCMKHSFAQKIAFLPVHKALTPLTDRPDGNG